MKITSYRLERTAYRPGDEPEAAPAVVFVGRSNVGKSSLINGLVGAKDLARTSARPGRTQSVNFYRINEAFYFVDLPGYGYSVAPENVRRSFGPMVEGFFERWEREIALAVQLVDARVGPTGLDRIMEEWLLEKGLRRVVAATKADKLSGNARDVRLRALRVWLSGGESEGGDAALLVSARTGLGIRDLWKRLDRALSGIRDRGDRWTSAH